MSRVGKYPVLVPSGVAVAVSDRKLTASGKLGQLSMELSPEVSVSVEDSLVFVKPVGTQKHARAMWGTVRALVNNMVKGVSEGFTRKIEINGVSYRAAVVGRELTLQLGYSHDVRYAIPIGVDIVAERPTLLSITGTDRQLVGSVAAKIRSFRPPEPYKGKGVKYEDEVIVRKEGKKK